MSLMVLADMNEAEVQSSISADFRASFLQIQERRISEFYVSVLSYMLTLDSEYYKAPATSHDDNSSIKESQHTGLFHVDGYDC